MAPNNASATPLTMPSETQPEAPVYPAAAGAGSPPGPPREPPGLNSPNERYEVVLKDGTTCAQILRKGKGKHLRQAARIAGQGADQMTFSMAMVAVKALVNREEVTLEQLLEMDDGLVLELIGYVMGGEEAWKKTLEQRAEAAGKGDS